MGNVHEHNSSALIRYSDPCSLQTSVSKPCPDKNALAPVPACRFMLSSLSKSLCSFLFEDNPVTNKRHISNKSIAKITIKFYSSTMRNDNYLVSIQGHKFFRLKQHNFSRCCFCTNKIGVVLIQCEICFSTIWHTMFQCVTTS